MNKQQLASKIWESANKMRSKIEANEYKDYILGFIFYKFLSEKEEEFFKKNGMTQEEMKNINEDIPYLKTIQDQLGYFISYENLFSTWLKMGPDFDVSNVRDALQAFNRLISNNHKKVFDNIFDTLQSGLNKLADNTKAQTKAIRDLINLINDIPMNDKQEYDVLGFIYEYLIGMFAANAGKKAGEFYTPHEVSLLMSEIVADHLKDRDSIQIYDPTSGSGSLLINIGKSISKYMNNKNMIKYYAQELKENTYNLTRMNLVMRGILPDNIMTRCGDTLEEDWPYFDETDPIRTYNPLYVDAVVSNPPYSQSWDPTGKVNDARYVRYGVAPKSVADYAFLLHDLYHLKPDGIMTIVLPHGVLFRGGSEGDIRKNLIENNNIDAIIGLPANIFFGTGIPTIIMVLKQKRENNDVLIIDASKGFIKEGKNNKLRACDIKKIVDTVINRETIDKFSKVVSKDEIRDNDYNLNIPRYVDSSEEQETTDIYATMFGGVPNKEINKLNKYWEVFPNLKNDLFESINNEYSSLKVKDVTDFIYNHNDIKNFKNNFDTNFDGLSNYLYTELIDEMLIVNVNKEESEMSENIFNRIGNNYLINKYDAYQLLDDEWNNIIGDLEIIQSEGKDSIKKVDPNMIIKKKNGVDAEVQDGWKGHILPFELVQNVLLKDTTSTLNDLDNKIEELKSNLNEIIESCTEEDKSSPVFNDDGTEFVTKELTNKVKELKKSKEIYEEDSFEYKLIKSQDILDEIKEINKSIKDTNVTLLNETKTKIENLTDNEINELLINKWINPIVDKLLDLPNSIIDNLATQIQNLSKKYDETLEDIEKEISSVEKELCSMIDDLTGNEYDLKGLNELKLMLGGNNNE